MIIILIYYNVRSCVVSLYRYRMILYVTMNVVDCSQLVNEKYVVLKMKKRRERERDEKRERERKIIIIIYFFSSDTNQEVFCRSVEKGDPLTFLQTTHTPHY